MHCSKAHYIDLPHLIDSVYISIKLKIVKCTNTNYIQKDSCTVPCPSAT